MEVSSPVNNESTPTETLKKAIDTQDRDALKVIQSATEDSKQVTAQKTGLGNHLNVSG